MTYELPTHIKMSKKEEKETSEKLNTTARSFLNGFFFFITVPSSIYKKIKKAWKWNPTGEFSK